MEIPLVLDLGWANGWNETPEIVEQCWQKNHPLNKYNHDRTQHGYDTEVRCDICGYVYHFDSSG